MSFFCMGTDVLCEIYYFLDTRDLLHMDIVCSVPSVAWDREVQRRCGRTWPTGKRGIRRLYDAVKLRSGLRCCTSPHWIVSAGPSSAHSISASGVWAWHRPGGVRSLGACGRGGLLDTLSIVSACTVNENCVAIGHAHGVLVHVRHEGARCSFIPFWTGVSVTGIAYVGSSTLWVVTSQQSAYAWSIYDNTLQPLCPNAAVHCVSGPRALAGTSTGIWPPAPVLRCPCIGICQSAVLIAALHANGHICTLDTENMEVMHVFDVNPRVSAFSVIADMVCIDGNIWSRGRRRGMCPSDVRAATHDGRIVLVTQAHAATLCVSLASHGCPNAGGIYSFTT